MVKEPNKAEDPKTPTSQRYQIQPRDAQGEMFDGADLGPGLGRDFPLRLELLIRPEDKVEPGGSPFFTLSDDGRSSRVFLGRIRAGHRSSERYLAVKLQTPRPPYELFEDSGGRLTHRVREARWKRELGHYLSVAGVESGFSELYFVEPAPERSDHTNQPRPWPPLLYCRKTHQLFRPLSALGTPLVTCRDDAVLRGNGLPAYSESIETFLYNEADIAAGAAARFYQLVEDGEEPHPKAADHLECLRNQASVPGLPGNPAPELGGAEDIKRFAELAATFPCLSCTHREECYGEEKYLENLTPFAFEDTNALVIELNDFHYDEMCDLLGGVRWKEFFKTHLGDGATEGQTFRLRNVERLIEFGRRYLFAGDGSGLDALEILKLKWTLFTQACQSVYEFHRRCGTAHLRVEPQHMMVRMDPTGEYLPTMWQFRTHLISLGAPAVDLSAEHGETGEILMLPFNSNPVYDAEIVRNSSFGIVQRGGFLLTSLDETDKAGRYIIKAEIHHEGVGMGWLSLKDRIKITLRHIVGTSDLSFFCLRDPDHDYSQRELIVRSHPIELSEQQVRALTRIHGVKVHNAGFALYPLFQVPCDIFSLGMLLFRTLVVNDEQGIGDVSLGLEGLKQDLSGVSRLEFDEGQESDFWEALIEGHVRHDVAKIFGREQIFYSADDRYEDRPNAIPEKLWNEALALGMQMITTLDGFSICANHGDFDHQYAAGKMEPVLRRSQEILRKMDTALFSMSKRNAEIRAAIDSVMNEAMK